MAIVRKKIDITRPLTREQKNAILRAASKPPVYDEDAPELTDDQIEEIKGIIDKRRIEKAG